jgi:hypothetical protein
MYEKRQTCGAAIRLPGLLDGAGGAGEEEGKLMTWLKGLPGAQAPLGPFGQTWSRLVKPSQSENRGLTEKPRRGCEIS